MDRIGLHMQTWPGQALASKEATARKRGFRRQTGAGIPGLAAQLRQVFLVLLEPQFPHL